jgi:hypothetical protein
MTLALIMLVWVGHFWGVQGRNNRLEFHTVKNADGRLKKKPALPLNSG